MPAWRAFAIILAVAFGLEGCDPVLLLAPCGDRKQLKLFGFDVAVPIGVLDRALQARQRKALLDVAFGESKRLCDISDVPPLLQELCERLIFFELVHRRTRAFSISDASMASASLLSAATAQGSNASSNGTPCSSATRLAAK